MDFSVIYQKNLLGLFYCFFFCFILLLIAPPVFEWLNVIGFLDSHLASFNIKNINYNHNIIYDPKYLHLINKLKNYLLIVFGFLSLITFFMLSTKPMSRDVKIQYITFGVLLGFFVAVIFHYISYFYWGEIYPHNTFLYYGLGESFKDFYDTIRTDASMDPYYSSILRGEYFPFAYVLMYPFTFLTLHAALFFYYSIFFAIYLFFIRHYFAEQLSNQTLKIKNATTILILGFMSCPLLFSFERGNIELFLFLFLATFLFLYTNGKIYRALPFLIAATAMKAYPIVFLALILSDKRYKAATIYVLSVIVLELISLAILNHGILHNFMGLRNALSGVNSSCTLLLDNCTIDSVGLWASFKIVMAHIFTATSFTIKQFKIYFILTVLFFLFISIYVIFIEETLWKKIALLTFSMLLFPVVSYDYKLLHLYLPIFYFVTNKQQKFDLLYASLFIAFLIPKNYYVFANSKISICSLIDPALLLTMLFIIILQGTLSHRTNRRKLNNV